MRWPSTDVGKSLRVPEDRPACRMRDMLDRLEETLRERKAVRPHGSDSAELFADPVLVQRKVMEEAFEVCLELGRQPLAADRLTAEAADLVFHLTVGLVSAGLGWDDVLGGRAQASGQMTARVALPSRGRLRKAVGELMAQAGLPASGRARSVEGGIEFIEMRPRDAGAWLAAGRLDAAFVSTDVVMEVPCTKNQYVNVPNGCRRHHGRAAVLRGRP